MIVALRSTRPAPAGMGFSFDSLVSGVSSVLALPTQLVSQTTEKTIAPITHTASAALSAGGGLVNQATDFGNNLATKIVAGLRSLKGGSTVPPGTTVNAAGQLVGPNGLPVTPTSEFPWGLVLGGVAIVGLAFVLLRRRAASAPAGVAA